jgi:hypothetical protein
VTKIHQDIEQKQAENRFFSWKCFKPILSPQTHQRWTMNPIFDLSFFFLGFVLTKVEMTTALEAPFSTFFVLQLIDWPLARLRHSLEFSNTFIKNS